MGGVMATVYRNYVIARLGDKFVAQSRDDECILVSSTQQRLHTAIDDLWASLDRGVEPAWFSGSTSIDLDTFGPESVSSSADPPAPTARPETHKISYWLFGLTTLLVSASLSYLMETFAFPMRVDAMLTLGVCAVAVYGRRYALIATAIAALVLNFFATEPFLEFSMPTASEIAFSAFNLLASIGIPELLKKKCLQAKQEKGRTGRT
ncbi:DUF4118 domain-containing protein [Bradyrhizobium sp. DASA03007]|uniref:DUF4118 domain-containing protein n=1 Tax=unclassified Bradyrhizobium TaxID=2631580 RepID=UPI003F70E9F5